MANKDVVGAGDGSRSVMLAWTANSCFSRLGMSNRRHSPQSLSQKLPARRPAEFSAALAAFSLPHICA